MEVGARLGMGVDSRVRMEVGARLGMDISAVDWGWR